MRIYFVKLHVLQIHVLCHLLIILKSYDLWDTAIPKYTNIQYQYKFEAKIICHLLSTEIYGQIQGKVKKTLTFLKPRIINIYN